LLIRAYGITASSPRGKRQSLPQDEGVDGPQKPVTEGAGQRREDFEAEALPEADGRRVGAHDEIELDGEKPEVPGPLERVLSEEKAHPQAAGLGVDTIGGGGDVGAPAGLVRPQGVGPHHRAKGLGTHCSPPRPKKSRRKSASVVFSSAAYVVPSARISEKMRHTAPSSDAVASRTLTMA
jgi:hypothetical protein